MSDLDGGVDLADFAQFGRAWQAVLGEADYDAACDIASDEVVDVVDLVLFSEYWLDLY